MSREEFFDRFSSPRNDRKNGLRRNENVSKRAIIIFRNTRDYIQECVRGILGYWYSSNNNKLCSFIYIYIYILSIIIILKIYAKFRKQKKLISILFNFHYCRSLMLAIICSVRSTRQPKDKTQNSSANSSTSFITILSTKLISDLVSITQQ